MAASSGTSPGCHSRHRPSLLRANQSERTTPRKRRGRLPPVGLDAPLRTAIEAPAKDHLSTSSRGSAHLPLGALAGPSPRAQRTDPAVGARARVPRSPRVVGPCPRSGLGGNTCSGARPRSAPGRSRAATRVDSYHRCLVVDLGAGSRLMRDHRRRPRQRGHRRRRRGSTRRFDGDRRRRSARARRGRLPRWPRLAPEVADDRLQVTSRSSAAL